MLVKTPAMKLGVEVRGLKSKDGQLILEGVAGAMPCTVELGAPELRRLMCLFFKPENFLKIVRLMFTRKKEK